METLLLLAEGMTHREIADEMLVSTETVRKHTQHLFAVLGARNAAHAVALAYHFGILEPKRMAA